MLMLPSFYAVWDMEYYWQVDFLIGTEDYGILYTKKIRKG